MTVEAAHGVRRPRAWAVALGALGLVVVASLAVVGWNGSRSETAQITGYSRDSPTVVTVEYVRGPGQSIISATAEESTERIMLHVVLTADPLVGGSGTRPAFYYSTTVSLTSPIGDRRVVDDRGDEVVEQPPGVIQAPRG